MRFENRHIYKANRYEVLGGEIVKLEKDWRNCVLREFCFCMSDFLLWNGERVAISSGGLPVIYIDCCCLHCFIHRWYGELGGGRGRHEYLVEAWIRVSRDTPLEAHRKGAISNLKSSCAVLDRYIDNFYAYHKFQNFNPPSLSADYYGTLILTSSGLRHSAQNRTSRPEKMSAQTAQSSSGIYRCRFWQIWYHFWVSIILKWFQIWRVGLVNKRISNSRDF
jgi:hypothetical protein